MREDRMSTKLSGPHQQQKYRLYSLLEGIAVGISLITENNVPISVQQTNRVYRSRRH